MWREFKWSERTRKDIETANEMLAAGYCTEKERDAFVAETAQYHPCWNRYCGTCSGSRCADWEDYTIEGLKATGIDREACNEWYGTEVY